MGRPDTCLYNVTVEYQYYLLQREKNIVHLFIVKIVYNILTIQYYIAMITTQRFLCRINFLFTNMESK